MSTGYRVNIIYATDRGEAFDWDHYMARHLPLAVGTSMRHAGILSCDVDRPWSSSPSKVVCICTVYFDSEESLAQFCTFFATGHPESQTVIADQPNYTTIAPCFVTARYASTLASTSTPLYRCRLLVPASSENGATIDVDEAAALFKDAGASAVEVDTCLSGIPQSERPAYSLMLNVYFDNDKGLREFGGWLNEHPSKVSALLGSSVLYEIVQGDVLAFDLTAAERIRDQRST